MNIVQVKRKTMLGRYPASSINSSISKKKNKIQDSIYMKINMINKSVNSKDNIDAPVINLIFCIISYFI